MEQENPYYSQSPPPIPAAPPPIPMQLGVPHGHHPPTTADDRSMAMLCHLLTILTGFIGPLILWLVKKDTSPFVNHHGKEALNFQITMFLVSLIVVIASVVIALVTLGTGIFLLFPIFMVFPILILVAEIMACVAANRGEWYRYPCCIRIL
ncbi:MAG TPA: DUF4870 domain-containing protein [Luteolibacter sp.]|nr:DUF4870 domain-containing protein [Luteolibacter sp.]